MSAASGPPEGRAPEETTEPAPPRPFEGDPQRLTEGPRRSGALPIVVGIVAAGVALYLWMHPPASPPAPSGGLKSESPPAEAPHPTQAVPAGPRHPVEPAVPEAALPPLAESDGALLAALTGLADGTAVEAVVLSDGIVRRIVATVDNLPRKKAAPRLWPVRPAPGWLATDRGGDGVVLGAANAARYAVYMRLVEGSDPKALAALYLRFYPLFQEAYRELGYPQGHFNDRLVEAIDDLLATPTAPVPVRLAQPKVLYEYADPALEQRSAGQKVLLRIGGNNAAIVKAKLKEFRREVTEAATRR